MKKIRLEKSNPSCHILSQKRASLKDEALTLSSKPEWRGPSPGNIENGHSSKLFFQNMKSELCNIKNDFEKLIRKQITLNPQQDALKVANGNRQKSYNSARRDNRSVSEYEKMEFVQKCREPEESMNRILNLQKNLPCYSEQKNVISRTVELREEKVVASPFDCLDIKSSKLVANQNQNQDTMKRLNEVIKKLEEELRKSKKYGESVGGELKLVSNEKLQLIGIVSELKKELTTKNEIVIQMQKDSQELKKCISALELQRSQSVSGQNDWANERSFFNQQMSDLAYHNQELRMFQQQVISENQLLKERIDAMQRFCQDLQKRCGSIEADWKRKLDYLQKDLQSYQMREDMFTVEIQKLNQQLRLQQSEHHRKENASSESQVQSNDEIGNLKDEIFHLERQLGIEKELHLALAKKYESQVTDSNNVTGVMKQFELKVTELVDENAKLKTKINYMQSSFQSLTEQNKSYAEQIRLYQEREKNQTERKQLRADQWEEMTEQIELLKEQNKKLAEELQYNKFDKQMEVGKYQSPVNESLLKLTHEQLAEIQQLRENIYQINTRNCLLAKELEESKKQKVILSMNANGQVSSLLSQNMKKQEQMKALKELIFEVIIRKAKKREGEEELQTILSQLQSLKRDWGC